MQIKKENEPTHRARRGALQSSVVFTHNIKSIINFKSNKTPGGGGGHSQTNVLPTRVQTPQKWTLNGVLRHIKFAPLNGVTPVKHNLNGVIMGVTYPKWRTLLWYTVQYPKWRTLLWYTLQYPKWRTVYMVHSTIP